MSKIFLYLILLIVNCQLLFAQNSVTKFYTKDISFQIAFASGINGCKRVTTECWKYSFFSKLQYDSIKKVQPNFIATAVCNLNKSKLVDTCFDKYPADTNKRKPIKINKPRDNGTFMVDGVLVRNDVKSKVAISSTPIWRKSDLDSNYKYYNSKRDIGRGGTIISCGTNPQETKRTYYLNTFYTKAQYDSIIKANPKFKAVKITDSTKIINFTEISTLGKNVIIKGNQIALKKNTIIDTVIKYYLPAKPQKKGYAMNTKGCKTISFNPLPPIFFTQTQYDSIKKVNPKFQPLPIRNINKPNMELRGNRTSNTTYCPDGLLLALPKDDESQIKRIYYTESIPICNTKSIEIDSLSKTEKITKTPICQAAPIIPKDGIQKDSFLNGRKYQPKTGNGITLGGSRTQTIDFQVISATDTTKQTFDVYKLNTWVDSLEKVNIKVVGNSKDTIKRFCFDGSMYELCRIHFGDTIRLVYSAHTLRPSTYQAKSNNGFKIIGGRPTVCDIQFYDDKGKPISIQEYEAIQRRKNRWYRKLFR